MVVGYAALFFSCEAKHQPRLNTNPGSFAAQGLAQDDKGVRVILKQNLYNLKSPPPFVILKPRLCEVTCPDLSGRILYFTQ